MKYIDAEKLKAEIKRYKQGAAIARFDNAGEDADYFQGKVDLCNDLTHIITSFQQEQPETLSGEEVMTMCNQILIDWVKEGKTPEERERREQAHIRFFELYDEYMQEQPEVDLEKYKKYDEALAIAKAWYKSSASSAQERNVARMIMGDIVMD